MHTAARAVGLARAALEDSILYLQEREQFGHPIGDFQALRFAVAEMAAQIEQSRAFYRQVAHLLDLGVPCEKEASMVKLEATEMSVRVTNQAMQLHGGNGYTTERQVERHWRDARLTTIFEGTSEIQKRIISDRLLPRSPLTWSDCALVHPVPRGCGGPAHKPIRGCGTAVQTSSSGCECSPGQIAGRLPRTFPDDEPKRVSPTRRSTRRCSSRAAGALRRELTACLRTGRALRKPRRCADGRRRADRGHGDDPASGPPRPTTGRCPATGRAT